MGFILWIFIYRGIFDYCYSLVFNLLIVEVIVKLVLFFLGYQLVIVGYVGFFF